MFVHHRAIAVICVIGAVIAVVVAMRAGSAAPQTASLTWDAAPSANPSGGAPQRTSAPSAIPVPQASPSASHASSPGGLQLPLSAMFQQLNNETRNTAIGQYAILQEIGDAIRDRVTRFLTSVTGGP
jgi:hypothetical protein